LCPYCRIQPWRFAILKLKVREKAGAARVAPVLFMPRKKAVVHSLEVTASPIPPDAAQVRQAVASMVIRSSTRIVEGLIAQAESGNTQAAKFLFDLVKLMEVPEPGASHQPDTLAAILLQRLGLAPMNGSEANIAPATESQ